MKTGEGCRESQITEEVDDTSVQTPALSRQSPLIKLPILLPHNKIEHQGVSKYVCLLVHTQRHTHLDTHCHGNTDSADQPEWHQCGRPSLPWRQRERKKEGDREQQHQPSFATLLTRAPPRSRLSTTCLRAESRDAAVEDITKKKDFCYLTFYLWCSTQWNTFFYTQTHIQNQRL